MADTITQLRKLSTAPDDGKSFNEWLDHKDAIAFLKENAKQDELVVYAGLDHTFIHAVGVPAARVDPPDWEDLLSWNFNSHDNGWSVCYSSNPPEVSIEPPLAWTSSKTLQGGTKLVFPRSFEGFTGEKHYYEALQEYTHVFGLHYVAERKAYCRLDKNGDVEDCIRITHLDRMAGNSGGTAILFRRELLDEWMALTDSALVQTFDFTRFRASSFGGWSKAADPKRKVDGELGYRSALDRGLASYVRGVQLVRSRIKKETLIDRFGPSSQAKEDAREYASFIALDWKKDVVREISTAPGETANYFTKSDLPFELSPAFFRPDVLQKYKADSDKYKLGDRTISCRGAWNLQTYDINERGQVHTYIVFLRNLPYEEQLYWKSYNENPKGPISKRAFTTDFKGEWDLNYDPLPSIKSQLEEWDRRQVPWWRLRNESLADTVHYPVTTSADEWATALLNLDQLVVEGLEERWLRRKVKELGRDAGPTLLSLKLIEECLMGIGHEEEHARRITAPLHELHFLRSKVKGHASGKEANEIKRKVISTYSNYRKHFEALCGECDEAIRAIDGGFTSATP